MACCSFYCVVASISLILLIIKIYLKLTTGRCTSPTCLVGKTAIVTGANSGIGYETALDFAKRGARVILACRNKEKAQMARCSIIRQTDNNNVVVGIVDMSSLESVRKFAKEIGENEERLDILVNNAGAFGIGDRKSCDGLQLLMQINYFSSFLLTNLLIDLLKKSAPSRVVNVSSILGRCKKINLENLNEFEGISANYFTSKVCNILFTKELAKRLAGTGVTTYSLHPGTVKTDIFRHFRGVQKIAANFLIKVFFKTSKEGAQTTIYTAVTKGIEQYSGEHFADCKKVCPYRSVKDPALPGRLWERTKEIMRLTSEEIQY